MVQTWTKIGFQPPFGSSYPHNGNCRYNSLGFVVVHIEGMPFNDISNDLDNSRFKEIKKIKTHILLSSVVYSATIFMITFANT